MDSHANLTLSEQHIKTYEGAGEEPAEVSACGDFATGKIISKNDDLLKTPPQRSLLETPDPRRTVRRIPPPKHSCMKEKILPLHQKNLRINLLNIKTPKSVKQEVFEKFVVPRCRRSLSMVELSPKMNKLRDRKEFNNKILKSELNAPSEGKVLKVRAARRIMQVLLLNAWRNKRIESANLQESILNLQDTIDHSQIQIHLLRNLQKSEHERLTEAKNEITNFKSELESTITDKNALEKEKSLLNDQLESVTSRYENSVTQFRNVKNDLDGCRDQASAAELQLQKERDKVTKLRDDKKFLLEKVQNLETNIINRETELLKIIDDLRHKLVKQNDDNESELLKLMRLAENQYARIQELQIHLKRATTVEKPKSWWDFKICSYIFGASSNIKHAASIMFPALPPS